MSQGNTNTAAESRPSPAQATSFALRGLGQVYDLQVSTARALLQAQARTASAFGWPDWSGVFDQVDERARKVFSTGAEQLVQATQRTNEAAIELQQQVGRVVQTQAATVAENLQHSLQEFGEQAGESLKQLCDNARLHAEQAERAAESASQEFRETLREGSAQTRQALREGGRQFGDAVRQTGEQAGELLRQGGQQLREETQRTGDAILRSGEAVQSGAADAAANALDGTPAGEDRSSRRKNPPQASAA